MASDRRHDRRNALRYPPHSQVNQSVDGSLDLDPQTGRYLYYVPGAHGGAERDGSPLVQYDLEKGTRKVIAFLHPFVFGETGFIPMGSYSVALSEDGTRAFITWNGNTGAGSAQPKKLRFNTCALTVVEIPASERQP